MTTNKPVVAVIGSGYWGKNLIRNYHELGVLKLICDNRESILKVFKEQYPGLETCVAANDIYGDPDIDGVVIATPAETHFTLAREALLANKHVYVEKPLVLNENMGKMPDFSPLPYCGTIIYHRRAMHEIVSGFT